MEGEKNLNGEWDLDSPLYDPYNVIIVYPSAPSQTNPHTIWHKGGGGRVGIGRVGTHDPPLIHSLRPYNHMGRDLILCWDITNTMAESLRRRR